MKIIVTLKKLPFLTPEEKEERLKDMGDEAMNRYGNPQEPPEDDDGGDDE